MNYIHDKIQQHTLTVWIKQEYVYTINQDIETKEDWKKD